MPTTLELEVLNHYPSYGSVPPIDAPAGAQNDCSLSPYRSGNLPDWETNIINHFPLLYRSEENVGFEDYTHLVFGFQVDEKWAGVLRQMSEFGTRMVQMLRTSGSQPDARIAIVRVRDSHGRLHIEANNNLRAPHRETWCAFLESCSQCNPEELLPC